MYPGHWAKIHGNKAAAINSETGDSVSYTELNDRSNQLAQLMYAEGLRKGDHVAILMENNLRYFEFIWAALRSGLYFTTVNRYLTADEAAYIINDCEAKVLVTSAALSETAKDIIPLINQGLIRLMSDGAISGYTAYEDALAKYEATPLAEQPCGAVMLYSSGTTGLPKGIIPTLPKYDVEGYQKRGAALQKALWAFDENTCYLSTAPNYHSAPISFMTATQTVGGTVVMMPKFDALASLKAIEEYQVTHSQWVPTMFSRLLKLTDAERKQYKLSSLKVALHAAAPCPKQVKQQMIDWWGMVVYEYYSATEAVGLTHVTSEEWLKKPGTVGKPVFGILHVCDDEGNEVPTGESGLLYFEMPRLPFTYHKDEAKTKDTQHPRHENWAAIGDVGYVDEDGFLFLNDRANFMIISGGVNIYPQEIEDSLMMHPKVADVAVFGVPNKEMGEEVKAVVQLEDGIQSNSELIKELMDYARDNIAHYKCPKSIDFLAKLPRLPTGKLYKKPLRAQYWEGHESGVV